MANLFLATYGTMMHTYIHMYTVEHMHTAHSYPPPLIHAYKLAYIHLKNTHMHVFHHTRFTSLWCYIKET